MNDHEEKVKATLEQAIATIDDVLGQEKITAEVWQAGSDAVFALRWLMPLTLRKGYCAPNASGSTCSRTS